MTCISQRIMEYEKLLKEARSKLPESVTSRERFEIPKVKGHIQGNKTIISNFFQIAGVLRRETAHILKYILKVLATPGEVTKSAVIIGAKVPASRINEKIQKYADEFVICKECGKPDTKIIKESGISFIKCLACGAKHPVKGL